MPGKLKDEEEAQDGEDDGYISMKGSKMHCSLCATFLPNDTPKGIKQHLKSKTHKQNLKSPPQADGDAKKVGRTPRMCIKNSLEHMCMKPKHTNKKEKQTNCRVSLNARHDDDDEHKTLVF